MPEVTISIPTPVYKAANQDSEECSRYAGAHNVGVFATRRGSLISATDGRMLAFVQSEVSGLGQIPRMLLPHAAVKAAKKTKANPSPTVMLNGRAEVCGGASFPMPASPLPFPDVSTVIPRREHMQDRIVVSLDPKALLSLAEALGSTTSVSLVVDPAGGKPIAVLPSPTAPKSIGLLMPTVGGGDADREKAIDRLDWARRVVTDAVLA
jgi:hypothetical protein